MMTVIRRGERDDLHRIAEIQAASPEAAQWSVEDYLLYDFRVAEQDGVVIGFLVGRTLGAGESEILNVAVAPLFRRKGIARSLVTAFLQSQGASHFLEVRESNAVARNFYKSIGFKEVNRRPGYYAQPPEAAIVMKYHSC